MARISIIVLIKVGGNNMCLLKDEHHFDFLWEMFVKPIILDAEKELDKEFKEQCDFSMVCLPYYKKQLEKIYKRKREWLKNIYLPYDAEPLLDMHKIGAVLCRAIIGDKPFSFDIEKVKKYVSQNNMQDDIQWYVDNVCINYKIAFYISIGPVFAEMKKRMLEIGKDEIAKQLEDRGYLHFYPKNPKHENFENSSIIALMKNDILKRDFDYLYYATMLFQLERYNYLVFGISEGELYGVQ